MELQPLPTVPWAGAPAWPLVGRAPELAMLRALLAAALGGRGVLALLGGEAGIGKTALAEALCAEATARGALVLVGRCYDLSETPPYGPWDELLDRLDAHAPDAPAGPAPGRPDLAAGSQAVLIARTRVFLAGLAARRPLVLLLEDLHWADPASLDLLRALARDLARLPILLLATYRGDELAPGDPLFVRLPLLEREAGAARLDLPRLAPAAVRALIDRGYPLPEADAAGLADYLHARADGNAFFTIELLRALEEAGALRPAAGEAGWALGDLAAVGVPARLRQVVEARALRLDEAPRGLLAVAAALGVTVPFALWTAAAGCAEEELFGVAEAAVAARLMEATADGAGIRFVHALVREALYESTLPFRRRALHRRIAEALLAGPHPDPDAVASHLQRAGDPRAGTWLGRAGDRAYRAFAYQTALARYEAALALPGDDDPDGPDPGWLRYRLARAVRYHDPPRALEELAEAARLATATGDRALVAVSQYHGHQLDYHSGDSTALERLAAAATVLEALPLDEWGRLAAHTDVIGFTSAADCLASLIGYQAIYGQFAAVEDLAGRYRALSAPPVPADRHHLIAAAEGSFGLGLMAAAQGRPAEARTAFAQVRDLYSPLGLYLLAGFTADCELTEVLLPYLTERVAERELLGAEVERFLRRAEEDGAMPSPAFFRASFLATAGDWAAAYDLAQATLADEHLISLRYPAQRILGPLARGRGEPDLAWRQVWDALPAGPDTAPGAATIRSALAMQQLAAALALDAGDPAGARPWLEAADRWLDWSGAVRWRAEQRLLWARCRAVEGQLERAAELAAEALALAAAPRQPLALLAARRTLGELATAAGQPADAATHLAAALALADACDLPHERALTLLALAEAHLAAGDPADAAAPLADARAILASLGARPALARADALAARLAPAAPSRASHPGGLTAREAEVLRLVAEGLTNAQVADRLYLSPGTIHTHLTSIYGKLGVNSRAAATRFALVHQLA